MKGKILRTTGICGLLLAAVFCVINWRISAGIILGMVCFTMYYLILNESFRDMTQLSGSDVFMMVLASIARLALMALPLLAGILIPQYFNIWGALAGFMTFKIAAVFETVKDSQDTQKSS